MWQPLRLELVVAMPSWAVKNEDERLNRGEQRVERRVADKIEVRGCGQAAKAPIASTFACARRVTKGEPGSERFLAVTGSDFVT